MERRRSVRVPLLATGTLLRNKEHIGTYRVLNLSAGGVLLAGTLPVSRTDKLELLLQLPTGRPLRLEAIVARESSGPPTPAFALQLVRVSPGAEDLIHGAVVTALQEARAAAVLTVSQSLEVCVALRRELLGVGQLSFGVSSPLDAVQFLAQPNGVSAVLVDASIGASVRDDLMANLADEHPGVARALLVSTAGHLPLESSDDHPLVQEVLVQPWTGEAIMRALPARRPRARSMLRYRATHGGQR
jgi:PilZ domain